ncbi:MAG: S-layer homology domain-containing protein [Chloroflexia bacterium]
MSRLHAIQIMVAAKGYDEDPTVQTFTDIPPASSYYRPVEQAVAHILISGYGCGGPEEPCDDRRRLYFRGDNPVTRSQFAKILTIAEGYNEYPVAAH